MRTPTYISPSAFALWRQNQTEYFLKYLSDNAPPRDPQNQAMSIGSAFDAYCKSFLHEALFGKGSDPKFDLDAIFEAQVEKQWWDWAREHGKYCFDAYKSSGVLADLMTELRAAQGKPRFEFEVSGAVSGSIEPKTGTCGPVVLLGKPDAYFVTSQGAHIILDFKVNGYCSNSPPSPLPGYMRMRSANRVSHGSHKNYFPYTHNGVLINCQTTLDKLNADWAAQLSIYAWLLEQPIGSDFIVGIDQLVCNALKSKPPEIRIAEHRMLVNKQFQENLFIQLHQLWEIVHSDHIFRDMSKEDSQARCIALDGIKDALAGEGKDDDAWFAAITRG